VQRVAVLREGHARRSAPVVDEEVQLHSVVADVALARRPAGDEACRRGERERSARAD
jgi:hypothetical protein